MKSGIDILARKLQGAHWSIVLFWNAFFGFLVPSIGLLVYILATGAQVLVLSSSKAWLWMLFGSCCDTLTALFNIIAFQNDSSSFVSLLAYVSVVWAFAADILVFDNAINGS
jgi:drug/metabolite transporter (DMT)-like permease